MWCSDKTVGVRNTRAETIYFLSTPIRYQLRCKRVSFLLKASLIYALRQRRGKSSMAKDPNRKVSNLRVATESSPVGNN